MTDFDAGTTTHDVCELYEAVAEDSGVKLIVTAQPDLQMHGSRELVGQAVANLLDNALKYGIMPLADSQQAADPPPVIAVIARRVDGMVEIAVADQGAGIAEGDRIHVLQRFVRLAADRSRPGSGLGLSLVAAVAHLHGGELRLADNGPGLRAVLSLPVREVALPGSRG